MPATQLPFMQVSAPKQPMQIIPFVPQAWFEEPLTQVPFSQHPVAHVVGPHAGAPPAAPPPMPPALPPPVGVSQSPLPGSQIRPGPQMTQAAPPRPQAARVVPP